MKPHGSYKLLGRHRGRDTARAAEPQVGDAMRSQRIVDSLRWEITNNTQVEEIRVRKVFTSPREIFRVELEVPELGYMRTTLLDRDALEELLEADEVRARVRGSIAGLGVVPGAGFEPARPEAKRF